MDGEATFLFLSTRRYRETKPELWRELLRERQRCCLSVCLSVYYVAVRTIVLSRHGNNLARPVIIHDIIHGLIYVPSTYVYVETAPTSIEVLLRPTQSQSDEPSDLRGSLSPTIVYTAPGSPRRSPIHL